MSVLVSARGAARRVGVLILLFVQIARGTYATAWGYQSNGGDITLTDNGRVVDLSSNVADISCGSACVARFGVCGYGTVKNVVTQVCEVALGEGTEVADGKCEITCSLGRRLAEQALQEGAQEAETSAAIVDGFLARHPHIAAKLNKEDVSAFMLELGQDFGLPALA